MELSTNLRFFLILNVRYVETRYNQLASPLFRPLLSRLGACFASRHNKKNGPLKKAVTNYHMIKLMK